MPFCQVCLRLHQMCQVLLACCPFPTKVFQRPAEITCMAQLLTAFNWHLCHALISVCWKVWHKHLNVMRLSVFVKNLTQTFECQETHLNVRFVSPCKRMQDTALLAEPEKVADKSVCKMFFISVCEKFEHLRHTTRLRRSSFCDGLWAFVCAAICALAHPRLLNLRYTFDEHQQKLCLRWALLAGKERHWPSYTKMTQLHWYSIELYWYFGASLVLNWIILVLRSSFGFYVLYIATLRKATSILLHCTIKFNVSGEIFEVAQDTWVFYAHVCICF